MKLRVFDTHIHFISQESQYSDFVNRLLEYSEKNNVEKMVLIGAPDANELVKKAFDEFPDRFLGIAWIDLDNDDLKDVELYKKMGFVGLKVILTDRNYDDPSYFPFYEEAQNNNMVILFHTGVIGGPVDYLLDEKSGMVADEEEILSKLKGKSSARMRSIYLDTIANSFPRLRIIGAHLGWPEYMISCAVARWRKNVYFDLSGGEVVRRHIIEGGYVKKEISVKKIIFGTDSSIEKMPREIIGWYDSLRSMGLSEEEIDRIFYSNAAEIYLS
ncbi:amidohydrolase family protein [Pseudothermotoga sp. U03pept]|uniref:amidohydrolase family protein n=1 Tax=Pseudothermotoga sp. U03pept TaxID=3447012 RepID=UPI003F069F64